MGCINNNEIDVIGRLFADIVEKQHPGILISTGIHIGTNSTGEKVSVLELKRTDTLQSFHEEIMEALEPYFSYNVSSEMVLSPPQAGESTLRWIREYPKKSSFQRFFPHITLGYGQLTNFPFPAKFSAQKLALCHLGNHCTCRKVLASTPFAH
jgi:hypothetical protein